MKKAISLALFTIVSVALFSQNEAHPKWQISLNYGIQDADKRLFSFPESQKKRLLSLQPENPKTYQLGLGLTKTFFANNYVSLSGGIGLSSELSTFERPFNLNYGHDLWLHIRIYTNRYYQNLLQLPFHSSFRVFKQFGINIEILHY